MKACLADHLRAAAADLAAAGAGTPRLDAQVLLQHVLGVGREALAARPERVLSAAEAASFRALVQRRALREPVSRILGRREFWSLPLHLGPAVLDPRPETETLVEAVLAALPDRAAPLRLLDLGTGSGCILLALLCELPCAVGLGVDASAAALEVAARNAAALGLAARADFAVGDWGGGLHGTFDVVVSNPPYIPQAAIAKLAPEVAHHDPPLALSGGVDGLDAYRRLAGELPALLAEHGLAALEIGAGQGPAVLSLFRGRPIAFAGRRHDLSGRTRCLLFRGLAASPSSGKKTVGKAGGTD